MPTRPTAALLGLALTNPRVGPLATRTPHRCRGHHTLAWHGRREERPKVRGALQLARNTTPSLASRARVETLPRAMVVEDVLGSVATAFRRVEVLKRPIW